MRLSDAIKSDATANDLSGRPLKLIAMVLFHPSLKTLFFYRLARRSLRLPLLGSVLSRILWRFSLTSGCHISVAAEIQPGLSMPHATGVVIGEGAKIGKGVTIYQNVTIGTSGAQRGYPTIEDGVTIYAGAVVVGAVSVGQGAVIGANAVVIRDVPSNGIAVGVPARFISAFQDKNDQL